MNYEQEVKKVYPEAVCKYYVSDITQDYVYFIGCKNETISCDYTTELNAWAAAYYFLKQQGLL